LCGRTRESGRRAGCGRPACPVRGAGGRNGARRKALSPAGETRIPGHAFASPTALPLDSTRLARSLFLFGGDTKIELPPLQIDTHDRYSHLIAQTVAALAPPTDKAVA